MLLRRYIISISVVLLLTFPSMRIATVSYNGFALPIQNYLSKQDQYTNEGKSQKAVYLQVKTSQDIISYTNALELTPPYPPLAANLQRPVSKPFLHDALKEIFIPPEFLV
jgi:hypothetical protein